MRDRPKISVIVASYNAQSTIIACLRAIVKQNIKEPFEMIVVDSSSDITPRLIRENFPQARLIHREQRTDYGDTRNLGVETAKGEIICFIDADCIANTDWLQKIYSTHCQLPEYAGVGGPFINGTPWYSLTSWAAYMAQQSLFFPKGKPRLAPFILGGNSSYKREVFDKYGRFDSPYGFDLLYGYRLRQKGEKLLFDPKIQVTHIHRTNLRDFLEHQLMIGEEATRAHEKIGSLVSCVIKHRYLAPFAVLILACGKAITNILRLLKWKIGMLFFLPLLLPVYSLGLLYWAIGFARGVYEGGCR